MRKSCWVAIKPGEEREYATGSKGWSEEFAKVLRDAGYTIIRVEYSVPPEFDAASFESHGFVHRQSRRPGEPGG